MPSAILFRIVSPIWRPICIIFFGISFFIYFSYINLSGFWAAVCVIIFIWEALFSRLYSQNSQFCLIGILVSIAVLGIFKYWNFITNILTAPLGNNSLYWADAFLPLGISFFTFEFIHYAVDRSKNRVERGTISEYMAFIFFFPTLVAGPIKRYQDFVPCLRNPSRDWATDWNRGLTRILVGLVKKFAFADVLTSLSDHLNYADIASAPRWLLLVWLFAYGWKIYFDFSAYSDIAIGSGRLFGIKIPENFDWPYIRTNISDFWKHWHMSLYKWLVDYIFIPIGGSRGALGYICRNIMIVMFVSGIWHGAGLNFVVWGIWHGALLVIHRLWVVYINGSVNIPLFSIPLFNWFLTYLSVNIGWAFFAMDLQTSQFFFYRLIIG